MRKVILPGIVALALSACSGIDLGDREAAAKVIADRLLGEVATPETRELRLAAIVAAWSELALLSAQADATRVPQVAGTFIQVRAALERLQAGGPDNAFVETDVSHVTLLLVAAVEEAAKARAVGILGLFAGGINVTGLVAQAQELGGKAAITSALALDIQHMLARAAEDPEVLDSLLAAASDRFDANEARIRAML